MIYCYYDKTGILREIINDSDNRQGTNNTEIFVYTERDDVNNISVVYEIGDVRYPTFASITQFANGVEPDWTVPYNKNINYKYFKDNTPYNFYKFIVPVDIMQYNGTCRATFSIHSSGQNQSDEQVGKATRTLGLLTFDIQDSVINKDDILTLSQWQYLLEEMAKVLQLRSRGVIGTNIRPTNGGVAPDNLDDGMFVLYYGTKTGEYTTTAGETIRGIELYEISGRTYQLRYESFTTSDRSLANKKEIVAHNLLYTQLKALVDELAAQHLEFVKSDELSEVAFTGEYADLKGKPFIPTKVSDLVNDSGFITNAVNDLINYYTKSETLTKDEIIARIGAIKTIKFEIYASLDDITNPQTNVIYLIGTASPYTEYAYIEEIGFEGIGSTEIDLSNYVRSDDTLNTDNIIVGNGDKKVKDSGYSVADSVDNNANKIPTNAAVLNEINKYHEVVEISGDSGDIPLGELDTPYRLIKDENGIYYRLVSVFEDENLPAYFYQSTPLNLPDDHLTDYFLWIWKFSTKYSFTRHKIELVAHVEFNELVASTPTDVIYDTNTKVVQLTHDGMPIGEGAVVDINGFTPYFDGETLVLSDLEHAEMDLATKQDKIESVKIVAPATATQGTLTATQLGILEASETNYIMFNHEKYYLMDKQHTSGSLTYSHVGADNQVNHIKTFTITLSNLTWVLIDTEIGKSEPAITAVDSLPTPTEEEFEKHKIYLDGAVLKYLAKEIVTDPILSTLVFPRIIMTSSAAAVGTDIYIFGGQITSEDLTNQIFKFDTLTGNVTTLEATLPSNRSNTSAVAVGTDIYIFGGGTNATNVGSSYQLNQILKFDTLTNSISVLPNTLPIKIVGGVAILVDRYIYIFGFFTGSSYSSTILRFDTITETAVIYSSRLVFACDRCSAAAVGNDIYIFGGRISLNEATNAIMKFDTLTGNVESLSAVLPEKRSLSMAAAVGNDIYIFGGTNGSQMTANLNSILKFSTLDESVETISTTLPQVLAAAAISENNNNIYIFGGISTTGRQNSIIKAALELTFTYKTITAE